MTRLGLGLDLPASGRISSGGGVIVDPGGLLWDDGALDLAWDDGATQIAWDS
ncbi:MAG: hypothetical protein IPI57_14395 [Candidatus Competibacteraceae bacterium]|nr:hypothetical protein [Candidatus Competibacteraceae bacterium]